MDPAIEIIPYDARHASETVALWRDSKRAALGIEDAHGFAEQVDFLNEVLAPSCRIYLALNRVDEQVVAMLACDDRWIHQLYVHVDHQRRGIGSRLVELARETSCGCVSLRCFARNRPARQFYERQGFTAVGRGWAREERLPDIEYRWESGSQPD